MANNFLNPAYSKKKAAPLAPMQMGQPSTTAYGQTPWGFSEQQKGILSQRQAALNAGQYTDPYERDPSIGGMANFQAKNILERRNFNHAYGNQMRTAMDNNVPGGGLMTNEAAAQMGNYKMMPNVTTGGSYGRNEGGMANMSDMLNARLGVNAQGQAVAGGETDPGTLGALRSRVKAPWMNGNQNFLAQGNQQGFDTTGTAPSTIAARAQRVIGSTYNQPGFGLSRELRMLPGGQVTGNYSMSPGQGGIDAQALVRQNPNAIYGFSPEMQKKLAMDPGYQQNLLARQQAYQQRQQTPDANLLARQQMVAERGIARGAARQERLDARKQPPNVLDQMMQQDPELAMRMFGMQQQNMLAGRQLDITERLGNDENAWRKQNAEAALAGTDADRGLKQQEAAANLLGAAAAIRATNPDLADQMEQQAMGQMGGQQGQNFLAGMQGAPKRTNPLHEEHLATIKSPKEKRDYMRRIMRLSDDEITNRLQENYSNDGVMDWIRGAATGTKSTPPTAARPAGSWDFNGNPFSPGSATANVGNAIYEGGKMIPGFDWGTVFGLKKPVRPTGQ